MITRRHFGLATASLAFAGLAERAAGGATASAGYGPLVADPAGLLDLPPGFAYRIIASTGETMSDGLAKGRPCPHWSCSATANRPGTLKTASPAGGMSI